MDGLPWPEDCQSRSTGNGFNTDLYAPCETNALDISLIEGYLQDGNLLFDESAKVKTDPSGVYVAPVGVPIQPGLCLPDSPPDSSSEPYSPESAACFCPSQQPQTRINPQQQQVLYQPVTGVAGGQIPINQVDQPLIMSQQQQPGGGGGGTGSTFPSHHAPPAVPKPSQPQQQQGVPPPQSQPQVAFYPGQTTSGADQQAVSGAPQYTHSHHQPVQSLAGGSPVLHQHHHHTPQQQQLPPQQQQQQQHRTADQFTATGGPRGPGPQPGALPPMQAASQRPCPPSQATVGVMNPALPLLTGLASAAAFDARLGSVAQGPTAGVVEQPTKKRKYVDPSDVVAYEEMRELVKSEPVSSVSPDNSGLGEDEDVNPAMLTGNYQPIKWQPFKQQNWAQLSNKAYQPVSVSSFRLDADKGFNYSSVDDSFVCQKKNHFQVTCCVALSEPPAYVTTPRGAVKVVENLYLHFYGVKKEALDQTIKIEQSDANRSKKPYMPQIVELSQDNVAKFTVGRLHFSETTLNNMRKKGKPNPDQRYFGLVVSLYAACEGEARLPIVEYCSQKIIIRASNPGQFESDLEVPWQKSTVPDGIYRMGNVGINTDRPEEALVVHGNVCVTGHVVQPSDKRVKEDIVEVDSREQLKNLSTLKVYKYKYKEEFAEQAGLSSGGRQDTGVLAQELEEVIPDAVEKKGDVVLPTGETVEDFLVVNKDRLYMESVGAVKELCKITDTLGDRMHELERLHKKEKVTRQSSSTSSGSEQTSASITSITQLKSAKGATRQCAHQPLTALPKRFCSNKFIQIIIILLIVIMAFCLISITVLYLFDKSLITGESLSDDGSDAGGTDMPLLDGKCLPSYVESAKCQLEPDSCTNKCPKLCLEAPQGPNDQSGVVVTQGENATVSVSEPAAARKKRGLRSPSYEDLSVSFKLPTWALQRAHYVRCKRCQREDYRFSSFVIPVTQTYRYDYGGTTVTFFRGNLNASSAVHGYSCGEVDMGEGRSRQCTNSTVPPKVTVSVRNGTLPVKFKISIGVLKYITTRFRFVIAEDRNGSSPDFPSHQSVCTGEYQPGEGYRAEEMILYFARVCDCTTEDALLRLKDRLKNTIFSISNFTTAAATTTTIADSSVLANLTTASVTTTPGRIDVTTASAAATTAPPI